MARRTKRGGIAANRNDVARIEQNVVHVTSFTDTDALQATERALYTAGQASRKRVKVSGALRTDYRHDMQVLLRYRTT